MNIDLANKLTEKLSGKTIAEQLAFLAQEFGDKIVFSTSFGWEDQVISHMIFANNIPVKVFTLDTGRMFEETYKVMNRTLEKYGKQIIPYFPDASDVEQLLLQKGTLSFYLSPENRKECCNIRKVKPLKRALAGVECWITGLRADQSPERQKGGLVEWDNSFNLFKFNPLLNWTLDDVKKYIKENNVPYNALHDKGFVSIGCEPCTRAIREGEDFRAGRWWWEDNSKKECGLHEKK